MKPQDKISEYDQQAIDFLGSTGTTLNIDYLYTGKYFHSDNDDRDIYQFTLKNDRGSYSSKFGDSLNNTKFNQFATGKRVCKYKEDHDFCRANKLESSRGFLLRRKRRTPGPYDILACLDSYCPDTFEEFCADYGYSDQPITEYDNIMRIFMDVKTQTKELKTMFSDDELDQLSEIA